MNAFAAAIEMLFADLNIGVEAIYTSDGGAPVLVRAPYFAAHSDLLVSADQIGRAHV